MTKRSFFAVVLYWIYVKKLCMAALFNKVFIRAYSSDRARQPAQGPGYRICFDDSLCIGKVSDVFVFHYLGAMKNS